MKERPILFSGPMVRAILKGAKTQTRRVVVPTMTAPRVAPLRMELWLIDGKQEADENGVPLWAGYHPDYPGEAKWFSCPYGQPGDRLWVRETWYGTAGGDTIYRADHYDKPPLGPMLIGWKPSIHMPRWASRLTLEVTGVRVERVQEISEADCCRELGAPLAWQEDGPEPYKRDMRGAFAILWDQINAKRGYSWGSNPWVWVVEFKKL